MSKIACFVIWICFKFTKRKIEQVVAGLIDILQDCNPEGKPKDDFQEKHPIIATSQSMPQCPLRITKPQHVKQEQTPPRD